MHLMELQHVKRPPRPQGQVDAGGVSTRVVFNPAAFQRRAVDLVTSTDPKTNVERTIAGERT